MSSIHLENGNGEILVKQSNSNEIVPKHVVYAFGINLSYLPGWGQFLTLTAVVFTFALMSAYCAELVFVIAGDFDICTSFQPYLNINSKC